MPRKKKNKPVIQLTVESIAFEGMALARKDNLVYFVKYAVPGDVVLVRVLRKRKGYVITQLLEVLEASPLRQEAKCSYFGVCGGCSWQNLPYNEQLNWKKQHVQDAFDRIGKIEYEELRDTLASPDIFNYRNKMEFSFGASRWLTDEEINTDTEIQNKNFALGLHIPGRFDKILDINLCYLQNDTGNEILATVKQKALELELTAYHQRDHSGFLRNLIIRSSDAYRELMLILITQTAQTETEKEFTEWFLNDVPKLFPTVASVVYAVNDTLSPVAQGTIKKIKGREYIKEKILDVDFKISPFSFFQTNSRQLNQFIGTILERAKLNSEMTVWDLYCGTGSITLPAARHVKKIYGFELVESSIADAKTNARMNEIENVEFHCLDLHAKDIEDTMEQFEKPDLIFIDPPRAGMHKNLVELIKKINCKTIVYVSCNPATQARDCDLLRENYKVVSLQPVDMFPQTYHVENIALLKSKNSDGD